MHITCNILCDLGNDPNCFFAFTEILYFAGREYEFLIRFGNEGSTHSMITILASVRLTDR